MTTTTPSSEPAVVFELTGDTVTITADGLHLTHTINTASTAPAKPLPLADVAEVASASKNGVYTPANRFFPGTVDLGVALPKARVMSHRQAAAQLLADLMAEMAKNPEFYSSADAFTSTLMPWVAQRAAVTEGVSVVEGAGDVVKRSVPFAPLPSGDAVAVSDIAPFAAFDVETANEDTGSIVQLGVAVVRGGKVTERYSWMCRPPKGLEYFDEANVAIHGITAADVAGDPSFPEQLAKFVDVVGDLDVVAHNARFDFTALSRACRAEGIPAPKLNFACTYMWARQMQLGLPNLKLPTLAEAAGASLENHHDATADAVACAEVALWLMEQQRATSVADLSKKVSLSLGQIGSGRVRMVRYDPSGVASTGAGTNAGTGASAGAQSGSSAPSRRPRRNAKWDAAKTPDTIPDPNPDADPSGLLYQQRVTLTGDFAPYDKGFLWDKIAFAGANINKGVTKKTTILVAGPWDSVTSKEKRARQLQAEGQEIQIWSEKELFTALGLNPEEDGASETGDTAEGTPSASDGNNSSESVPLFGSTSLPGDDGMPPF
ncbi:exonuclease domain-containing protein [Corynebacterium sp. MSK035]|uniref:exonuclease domain-containing protein n=1 Tax=unclassified Corynebacterium TaxID=2624378 RepID=UPI0008A2DDAF|nr:MULTISPECIES: exonuclease domain-containing protein [unclassified Corynebacterium]MDK8810112.1 exonuclease domain-containing protein [Corynebacterium sp. MSK035]OFL12466.1 DNA polymerase III subunit epsilon [Corynebacterium sp. HMSC063F04]